MRLISLLSLTRWFEVVDLHSAWFLSIDFNVRCENNAWIEVQGTTYKGYEESGSIWCYQRGKRSSCALGCDIGLLSMFTRPWSSSLDLSQYPRCWEVWFNRVFHCQILKLVRDEFLTEWYSIHEYMPIVNLKWMQWIKLPSSTFGETCDTEGYLHSIDSFSFVTIQDYILIMQNINYSKIVCSPKLRRHFRIKFICQLTYKSNVKWNLSNIHTGWDFASMRVTGKPRRTSPLLQQVQCLARKSRVPKEEGDHNHKTLHPSVRGNNKIRG